MAQMTYKTKTRRPNETQKSSKTKTKINPPKVKKMKCYAPVVKKDVRFACDLCFRDKQHMCCFSDADD